MTLKELQKLLQDTGRYYGAIDGLWGRLTEGAILMALTDGPDTALVECDYVESASRLGVHVAAIKAVVSVESTGAGFFEGKPIILAEPHRFSRSTSGRFNVTNPDVSYKNWGAKPYPRTQSARYGQLLKMIRLDVDAGFKSASYGKFQILGENYKICGYNTPAEFAFAMARDEATQLKAFEKFVIDNGLLTHMKNLDWAKFARGYNGSAYAKNNYDTRLAKAYRQYKG